MAHNYTFRYDQKKKINVRQKHKNYSEKKVHKNTAHIQSTGYEQSLHVGEKQK